MTSSPRSTAAAISTTLVEPQSTVTMTVAPAAPAASRAAHGQAVALVEPARDVRARPSTPNRRRARVMIARPVSPSASKSPKTRTVSPRSRARPSRSSRTSASGRSRGSCRPAAGSAEPRRKVIGRGHASGGEDAGESVGPIPLAASLRGLGRSGRRAPGTSSGSAVRSRRQDATSDCTGPFAGRMPLVIRSPCAGRAGCERQRGDRAGGRPRGASRRAAAPRRRSTSTSPR